MATDEERSEEVEERGAGGGDTTTRGRHGVRPPLQPYRAEGPSIALRPSHYDPITVVLPARGQGCAAERDEGLRPRRPPQSCPPALPVYGNGSLGATEEEKEEEEEEDDDKEEEEE